MSIAIVASILLVLATVFIHYEGLRLISNRIPAAVPGRRRVMLTVICVFIIHIGEIALYALAFWFFDNVIDIGSFKGVRDNISFDYFYFAAETFTTLGLGDIYPDGPLRLLASIESINGLLLLGWSTSFTFYQMQLFWASEANERPER